MKERPDAVVTTGSAPGMICLALAKVLTRARTMWIDSIANCERLSSSGKRARFFADVWLTQWPELSRPEGTALLGRRALIFVTIGSLFPFDRLIRLMDELAPRWPGEDVFRPDG